MADPQRLNPYRFPKAWGLVSIGGKRIPGVVQDVDGADKPEKWLIQMGISVSHAVTVWRGTQLAETITIKTNLPNAEAIDSYWALRDLLFPKKGSKPPSFQITNAIINFAGITRVSGRLVKSPKPAPGLSWVGEIVLVEFNPPKIAPVGPADPPKAKTANDLKADEVARLVEEAKRVSQ